jgi:cytidine deaminase
MNDAPDHDAPQELVALARTLFDRAHAPYSSFPVAAVAIDEAGHRHVGVNVENASYGLTICAERVAIFSAIASGAKRITALAVSARRMHPITPCGACRQVMAEFMSPDAPVHADAGEAGVITRTVGELLPFAFDARSLTR